MDVMTALGVGCLLLVCACALAGVFSRHYADNWLQFVGLWGVASWALARAWQLWDGTGHMSAQQLVALLSLAAYALGTACKVWRHRRGRAAEHAPLDHRHNHHGA